MSMAYEVTNAKKKGYDTLRREESKLCCDSLAAQAERDIEHDYWHDEADTEEISSSSFRPTFRSAGVD